MIQKVDYTVVIPVYNSAATLGVLYDDLCAVFEKINRSLNVIFVEDGGTDNSWSIIEALKTKHPEQIVAIRLSKNFGQHNATVCGFSFATGMATITIDDDLQIHPREIAKLINKYESTEADVVYGVFKRKKHSLLRNIGSYLIRKSAALTTGEIGEGSSFRLLDANVTKKIAEHTQVFISVDETINWYTKYQEFVQVEHTARQSGKSGYSNWKLFAQGINLIFSYSTIPLRLMTILGFIISIVCIIMAGWFIYKKLRFDVPMGFTAIIVSVFFASGIILFSLGIIGEYVNRIYTHQNKKPPYSIRKILK